VFNESSSGLNNGRQGPRAFSACQFSPELWTLAI